MVSQQRIGRVQGIVRPVNFAKEIDFKMAQIKQCDNVDMKQVATQTNVTLSSAPGGDLPSYHLLQEEKEHYLDQFTHNIINVATESTGNMHFRRWISD